VDQPTKAVQPTAALIVNAGRSVFVPDTVSDFLWNSQSHGALTDTVDTALLLAALMLARRLSNRAWRVGATMAFTGLLSNVADRLGAASLTHPSLPRGAIDWIPLGKYVTNLADIFIALGVLIFTIDCLRGAVRRLGPHRSVRITAAVAAVTAIAIWANFWQTNRHTITMRQQTIAHSAVTVGTAAQKASAPK
jgi:hypothetical protein